MQSLKYRITTLSPLIIRNNTGDINMVSTGECIPGTTILGALAQRYIHAKPINDNAHMDSNFFNWFLKGDLIFTNAYILYHGDNNSTKNNLPVPFSIQSDRDNENDIYDLLFYEGEVINENNEIINTRSEKGFGRMDGEYFYKQPVKKSLNFHHERDSKTGMTKKGVIFNYESIAPEQTFEGNILGEEEILKEILNSFGEQTTVYLGRSKSAQYGKVLFEIFSDNPEAYLPEAGKDAENDGEVSLTLISDTIIYNDCGFSTTEVKEFEKELQKILGGNARIKKSFIKTGEVENFVSVWKLRNPSETCFLMGSCFLIDGISPTDNKLINLIEKGVGERTNEGFGRVFAGWQKERELEKKEHDKPGKSSPDSEIPPGTKEIVQKILKEHIRKNIELEALREYTGFINNHLPSKSLIGRLEAMVKHQDKNTFRESIKALRNTAKDKLQRCHNKYKTLFEFLMEKDINIDAIIKEPEIGGICKITDLNPPNDTDYMTELYRSYFITFFLSMRRKLKQQAGE